MLLTAPPGRLELSVADPLRTDYSEFVAVVAAAGGSLDEAIAANVFGAPWYIVDGEAFWGQDRLDFVERALK